MFGCFGLIIWSSNETVVLNDPISSHDRCWCIDADGRCGLCCLSGTVGTYSVKTVATWSCPSRTSSSTTRFWCATAATTCCWSPARARSAASSWRRPSPRRPAERSADRSASAPRGTLLAVWACCRSAALRRIRKAGCGNGDWTMSWRQRGPSLVMEGGGSCRTKPLEFKDLFLAECCPRAALPPNTSWQTLSRTSEDNRHPPWVGDSTAFTCTAGGLDFKRIAATVFKV